MNIDFNMTKQGTDLLTEVMAGVTTLLATMYIIVVNPAIIRIIHENRVNNHGHRLYYGNVFLCTTPTRTT